MKHSTRGSKGPGVGHESDGAYQDINIDLESLLQNAGKILGELASQLTGETSEFLESGQEYIRKKPVKSLAIAAAAGAVLGSILVLALGRRR